MLIGGVIDNQVEDDSHFSVMNLLYKALAIFESSIGLMDILEVRYIIAHIDLGTFVVWRNQDNVDAEVLDIVKLGDNTGNIANAITIGVFEGCRVDLVDDTLIG